MVEDGEVVEDQRHRRGAFAERRLPDAEPAPEERLRLVVAAKLVVELPEFVEACRDQRVHGPEVRFAHCQHLGEGARGVGEAAGVAVALGERIEARGARRIA